MRNGLTEKEIQKKDERKKKTEIIPQAQIHGY